MTADLWINVLELVILLGIAAMVFMVMHMQKKRHDTVNRAITNLDERLTRLEARR